jgi:hypothetical protein
MKESIKRRLERLEETPEDNLLAMMKLDRPVLAGSAKHAAAIAEGRDVHVFYPDPDEPVPENPIL